MTPRPTERDLRPARSAVVQPALGLLLVGGLGCAGHGSRSDDLDQGLRTEALQADASANEGGTMDAGNGRDGADVADDAEIPFGVLSARPAQTAARNALLRVELSDPVAPDTVNAASFVVALDGQAVSGVPEVSGRQLVFRPDAPWTSGETYAAMLTTDIEDAAGHALPANYIWRFTVEPHDWLEPEQLVHVSAAAGRRLGVAANDELAAVVWLDEPNYRASTAIRVRVATDGSWGSTERIAERQEPRLPQIALHPQRQVAAWIEPWAVWAAVRQQDRWGTPVVLDDSGADATDVELALDSDGQAVVAWVQGDALWTNRFDGSSWGKAELVAESSGAREVGLALPPGGGPAIAWVRSTSAGHSVWFSQGSAEGWATPRQIHVTSRPLRSLQLKTEPSTGTVAALWVQEDVTTLWFSVWACERRAEQWSQPRSIETENAGSATTPRLALDERGNAVALWIQWDGSRQLVWGNQQVDAVWTTARPLPSPDSGDVLAVDLGFGRDGAGLAAWLQRGEDEDQIVVNRFHDAAWGIGSTLHAQGAGSLDHPRLAVSGSGAGALAWFQGQRRGVEAAFFR